MPRNIVLGTNDIEQKRQECIYELIYTEEDFTRDMHYVQDVINYIVTHVFYIYLSADLLSFIIMLVLDRTPIE